ncbi:conjugative transposon protein TraJ [Fulvivirga maritima]|uniref:conjugative transposon protein TraJ n=1 Tax=Fulvivirga maritima TaxID=2904247 RepID=UPI001F1A1517|nr:conjugative transposon protein TraJ [Fulvivirga maritima]UII29086.1 conjugative transposon protein TraJ [Fulvivirga maritima]
MKKTCLSLLVFSLLPMSGYAQGMSEDIKSMHEILEQLYTEMLPLCSSLIGVSQGVAAFASLWYIGHRVWKHLAEAEAIEVYPLLRPFAIGLCIGFFPLLIQMMNGVLHPLVTGTSAMVEQSQSAIEVLLARKEQALLLTPPGYVYGGGGDYDRWYRYTHPEEESSDDEGFFAGISHSVRFAMSKAMYDFRYAIKQALSEVLQVIFEAASLCINTIRTFFLLVLAIIGPLVLALSVFDGFRHSLTVYLARYVNIYLWLPVTNIFGAIIAKIQENMLMHDLSNIEAGDNPLFNATDAGYLIFLIIGIIGYLTVPSVSNFIINVVGSNAMNIKTTTVFQGGARYVYQAMHQVKERLLTSGGSTHQHDKLSGK